MFDPSKLAEMARQAQQMQAKISDQLRVQLIVGQAGGGMVRIEMNGLLETQKVHIEPKAIDPTDPTLLQDLVRAAFNDALAKAEASRMEQAQAMAGNLGIPGLFEP